MLTYWMVVAGHSSAPEDAPLAAGAVLPDCRTGTYLYIAGSDGDMSLAVIKQPTIVYGASEGQHVFNYSLRDCIKPTGGGTGRIPEDHGGTINVMLLDGHVESLGREQAVQQLVLNPKSTK